jgi:hypothetical protein
MYDYQPNGIQIYLDRIKDKTMIISLINNILLMKLQKILTDFMSNMVIKMKMKKNFSNKIIQIVVNNF